MVIPSINCPDFNGAREHIKIAEKFSEWIHIDVEDGKFTEQATWGDPEEFKSLETDVNMEVHLMVENPEAVVEDWLKAGAKRVIVHHQAVRDAGAIIALCKNHGAEAVLSLDPTISVEAAGENLEKFRHYQVLAVLPGPSGQEFQEESLEKISALQAKKSTATIEVDGGVTAENILEIRAAGADFFAVGNAIFGNPDPEAAYKALSKK